MNRHLRSLLAPSALLVAMIVILLSSGGCGSSQQRTVAPEPDNPFQSYRVGDDQTLEIVTWNLHNFAEDAGSVEVGLVAEAISALGADVVALQEIAQAVRFDELLGLLPDWGGHRATSDRFQNLAYIWLDSTVTVRSVADIRPPVDDLSRPFPRNPLLLEITWQGHELALVNNHFKCCGDGQLDADDPEDEESRRLEASQLLHEHLDAAYPAGAVVLLGDLNDRLDDAAQHNVFEPFLSRPERYRFADLEVAVGPSSGWSYGPGSTHLDHILITAPLFAAFEAAAGACWTLRLDQALPPGDFRDLMTDHAPVIMVLPESALP